MSLWLAVKLFGRCNPIRLHRGNVLYWVWSIRLRKLWQILRRFKKLVVSQALLGPNAAVVWLQRSAIKRSLITKDLVVSGIHIVGLIPDYLAIAWILVESLTSVLVEIGYRFKSRQVLIQPKVRCRILPSLLRVISSWNISLRVYSLLVKIKSAGLADHSRHFLTVCLRVKYILRCSRAFLAYSDAKVVMAGVVVDHQLVNLDAGRGWVIERWNISIYIARLLCEFCFHFCLLSEEIILVVPVSLDGSDHIHISSFVAVVGLSRKVIRQSVSAVFPLHVV